MDGNKDEALKCLRIGQKALSNGDKTRAVKFLNKARRLDPSLEIKDFISRANEGSADPSLSDSSAPNGVSRGESSSSVPNGSSSPRARVSSDKSSSSFSPLKAYTDEQISIVRQIKRQNDYYEILGLEKNCSVDDLRKAYRKLSLKVHPDKNKAPGAEEAFKAVSKAFQCLNNEESRRRYDLVGSEEAVYDRPTTRHGNHGFNGFYEADIDADEVFRNFFFGGMHPATTGFSGFRFGTGMGPSVRTAEFHGFGNSNIRTLIQLLPVLLLLLLNFLPSSELVYSLNRQYPYEHRLVTERGVPYFVKSTNFEHEYPYESKERLALEDRVEREFFILVSQNCRAEMQRRQWGLTQKTPYCDLLKQYDVEA
ncbi:chaperone protein dnaJ 49-like [Aristolochia californica]|uniref:chaperone protein dnaJ 49-like n=1 Tax=Aristolochia californica TaxID=171875 RepID=UPI0035D8EBCB